MLPPPRGAGGVAASGRIVGASSAVGPSTAGASPPLDSPSSGARRPASGSCGTHPFLPSPCPLQAPTAPPASSAAGPPFGDPKRVQGRSERCRGSWRTPGTPAEPGSGSALCRVLLGTPCPTRAQLPCGNRAAFRQHPVSPPVATAPYREVSVAARQLGSLRGLEARSGLHAQIDPHPTPDVNTLSRGPLAGGRAGSRRPTSRGVMAPRRQAVTP